MRKCINPLWHFHPSAVKYRGLCEADAAAAAADVVKAARFLPCFPDTGSKDFAARCRKTAPRSFGSLPRKRSFPRPGERRSGKKRLGVPVFVGETTELSTYADNIKQAAAMLSFKEYICVAICSDVIPQDDLDILRQKRAVPIIVVPPSYSEEQRYACVHFGAAQYLHTYNHPMVEMFSEKNSMRNCLKIIFVGLTV